MNIEGVTIIPKVMFTHDCDVCTHLGCVKRRHLLPDDCWVYDYYDMYLCKKCDEGSIIIRFGNDGPDYSSSMISMIPQMIVADRTVTLGGQMMVTAMHLALLKMIEDKP